MKKHLDVGSIIVIGLTLVLFVIALFTKGFTHDLLLETAVFLVSVKLIMMAHKHHTFMEDLKEESSEIKDLIRQLR